MIRFLPLVLLVGCVESDPVPYVGDCAEYPAGAYEYGQIGLGTCLAGPADLAFVGDRLLVSNANPWGDFTGGSLLSLDFASLPLDGDKHLVTELDPVAVALPSFMGDFTLAESDQLLLATNRLSEGARTREAADHLWFIDVSDPAQPVLAEDRGVDGASLEVGADPTTVEVDPATSIAYVVNRTDHSLMMVDLTARPAEVLPPGGPARVLGDTFVDVDGTGSRASFVVLEPTETTNLAATDYTLAWSVGAVRAWIPGADGLYRVTGNGEDLWERSALELDVDPAVSDGLADEISDPWFVVFDDADGNQIGRMFFVTDGVIRGAQATGAFEEFAFELVATLVPDETAWDAQIGGPSAVIVDNNWLLYYDGGDGQTQSIGLAVSSDGQNFTRLGDAPLLSSTTGESFEDPFVAFDSQADRWRMWFSVRNGERWTIGEAWSDDLETWTDTGTRWSAGGNAAAPAVQYYGGRFHLLYDRVGLGGDVYEAVSIDGTHWEPTGVAIAAQGVAVDAPRRVAFFALSDGAFFLRDSAGDLVGDVILPGDDITDSYNGHHLRIAAGQWLDPEGLDGRADGGVRVDAVHEGLTYLSLTEGEDAGTIGIATRVGRGFAVADAPALTPGAAGGWDDEQVSSAVVATIDGTRVLYYAGTADGVTRIGRATSDDGVTWTADADPVLEPEADWESVGMYPGSVTVGADGLLHLYYSAWDGGSWRVGEATSADGVAYARVAGAGDAWTFDGGPLGDWDDSGAKDAYVVWNDALGVDQMWYAGTSGEGWQIGYAERAPDGDWVSATTVAGAGRPVIAAGPGSIGAGGLERPVLERGADGDALWYAGLDADVARVGRAVLGDGDRAWRDLDYPTLADTWGFSFVPENDEDAIALGASTTDVSEFTGCATLARDDARGFLYVGCESAAAVVVVDIRDDSGGSFQDLNYLNVETLMTASVTFTGAGIRDMLFDPVHNWLWWLNDAPEAAYAVDLDQVEDDADLETVGSAIVASIPMARGSAGYDAGVDSQASVGPGRMILHPDGHHLFVSNFNSNSVIAYDLALGAPGTLVAEAEAVGENPYELTLSPDGRFLAVGNYSGEVEQQQVNGTVVILDADPASPTFLEPLAWIGNQ